MCGRTAHLVLLQPVLASKTDYRGEEDSYLCQIARRAAINLNFSEHTTSVDLQVYSFLLPFLMTYHL